VDHTGVLSPDQTIYRPKVARLLRRERFAPMAHITIWRVYLTKPYLCLTVIGFPIDQTQLCLAVWY